MKRTSASVLALLFASSKAVKLNNGVENFYDAENGLWRQSMVQFKDDPTAVKTPPEGMIGDTVYEHAMNATEGIPGNRDHSLGPKSLAQKKVDPISPENYDPWVYKFSKEQMGAHPQWHMDDNLEFRNAHIGYAQQKHKHRHHKNPNEAIIGTENIDEEVQDFASKHTTGLYEKKHHKKNHHHSKPDVAERGMDEEVHGFVSEYTPPLNTRVRSTLPFIPNGSHPSAFEGSASLNEKKHHKKHLHKKNPDVAERDMDFEVHGFTADKVSPENEIAHDKKPPAMNGGKAALTQTKKKSKAKDMAERGMDEEVYDFTSGLVSAINGQERPASAWDYNGVSNEWLAKGNKYSKKDVAERGMDEEVHGFVSEYTPPLNTRVRSTLPFIPNGSHPSAFEGSAAEKKHHKKHHKKHQKNPDIAERNMDEEVHGFVKEYTPPLNEWTKTNQPFVPNGSDPSAHDPSFAEKKHSKKNKDVAERGMDEEVHGFVSEYTPPLNTRVRSTLPFIPNGSHPSAFEGSASLNEKKHHKKHHKRPDVAERGMDEEVHGFVADNVPPIPESKKSDKAFVPNGSDPSAFGGVDSLNQKKHHKKHHKRPDVAERGMDEEVHGFVADNVPPIPESKKSDKAFVPNGSDPSAFGGVDSLNQKKHYKKHKKHPDVAERNMDEEVHGFVADNTSPINESKKSDKAFVPNGSDPSAFEGVDSLNQKKHHKKHHKKDVAERGMDEEVHGFVWHALPPLNTWERSSEPFVPNGSDPSAHDPSLAQKTSKDVIDSTYASSTLPPLSEQINSNYPPASNGSAQTLAQSRDIIAEPHWTNKRVQPYTSSHLPPLSEQWGSEYAWAPNGSHPSAQPSSLAQEPDHNRWHENEYNMNTDGWLYNQNMIDALSNRPERLGYTPDYNGEANKYESLAQHQDIAERGVQDDYVYPTVHSQKVVEPTPNPWLRPYLPYEPNGGSNVYAQVEAAPMKDIANKEVRPDVWVETHKHISPVALGRFREPRPAAEPEERTWDDGPKPKEEPEPEFKFKKPEEPDDDALKAKKLAAAAEGKEKAKAEKAAKDAEAAEPDADAAEKTPSKSKSEKAPSEEDAKKDKAEEEALKKADEDADKEEKASADEKAKKEAEKDKPAALVQADGDKKADGEKKEGDEDVPAPTPEPEKVHVLEPMEYKEKADTNTPNKRTTFYDKKSSKKSQV